MEDKPEDKTAGETTAGKGAEPATSGGKGKKRTKAGKKAAAGEDGAGAGRSASSERERFWAVVSRHGRVLIARND